MYCSASQRICSSSSSRLITGRLTFFTITEWPHTAAATFLLRILALSIASRIASVIAAALRNAPCTIASAGTRGDAEMRQLEAAGSGRAA